MTPRLRIYITLVAAVGIALLARDGPHDLAARWGHFLAWEQPEIYVDEVRETFKSLR